MLVSLFASSALALDPNCTAPYGLSAWDADMDAVDQLLQQSELEHAGEGLVAVQRGLTCLDVPADAARIARFDRQRAAWFFFDQDEEAALAWGTASRLAAPDLAWDVPEDHPFRALIEGGTVPESVTVPGAWITDRRGAVVVDGTLSTAPTVVSQIPHLVQVVDGNGTVVRATWQDGAAFVAGLVDPEGVPDDGSTGPREPRGDGERTPLLATVGAGALGVSALALYGLAAASASSVPNGTDPTAMIRARSTANALVIGAGAAGVAAVGVGVGAYVHGRF